MEDVRRSLAFPGVLSHTAPLLTLARGDADAEYVLLRSDSLASIPLDMDPAEAAPLLCAGVTVFNSLRHMVASPGDLVAVHGLGGYVPPPNSLPARRRSSSELGRHQILTLSCRPFCADSVI